MHQMLGLVCIGALVAATPAFSSDVVAALLKDAEKECRSFENGELTIDQDKAVTQVDVTGDGVPDHVVDSSAFACSTALSLFCGTGGCALDVVVDEKDYDLLAKAWDVEQGDTGPVLKTEVHWSECDYQSNCWDTLVWNGDGFDSLGAKVEMDRMHSPLKEDVWTLVDGDATIQFLQDGTVSGKAQCNNFTGTHETTYPDTSIGPLAVTRMACPDLESETALLGLLSNTKMLQVEGNTLTLITNDGDRLSFTR